MLTAAFFFYYGSFAPIYHNHPYKQTVEAFLGKNFSFTTGFCAFMTLKDK